MKLHLTLVLASVLAAGSLLPSNAEAANKSSHRESTYRESRSHKHHRHTKLVKFWVRGHVEWRHGHRHWVPGHYEYRRVYSRD